MRVLFSSMRMIGHIRPLLPYAHALLKRGHHVLVATPQDAVAIVRGSGFDHAVFGHPGDKAVSEISRSFANMPRDEVLRTAVCKIFAGINARAALPGLRSIIQSWKPDLIVRESMEFASMLAAMETNIPTARVASTNTKAEARIPTLASEPLDAIRQEAGLHPDSGETLHSEPAFTSFPPSLDGDAPQAGMVAPFRVRLAKEGHEPGRDVPAWAVDDGRPLVFLTFGTLAAGFEHTHVLFRAALEAAGGLQVRAVFSTGAAMEATRLGAIPGNVTVTPWVDQVDVYPHASLLVCHGGAGTVLAGVTYGLPMVITPISADQPDNARMMENAGAAIVVAEPDAESLRAAMSRGLSDKKMRAAAGQIADEMASMPSIDEAVRELEGIGLN